MLQNFSKTLYVLLKGSSWKRNNYYNIAKFNVCLYIVFITCFFLIQAIQINPTYWKDGAEPKNIGHRTHHECRRYFRNINKKYYKKACITLVI